MIYHQTDNSRGNYHCRFDTYFNLNFSTHLHRNYELVYVWKGRIRLTVNGVEHPVCEGEYALILSHQIHAIRTEGAAQIWIAVFDEGFVPLFASQMKGKEGRSPVFRCPSDVDQLIKEHLILSNGSSLMQNACFYMACHQYLSQNQPLQKREPCDTKIYLMLDYVAEHYRENISLATLAAQFGYEYHYLSHLLRNDFQIRFSDLLNQYRTDHAVRLLKTTQLSMSQIAMESGFQSVRSFNHTFRTLIGCAPGEYAKQSDRFR